MKTATLTYQRHDNIGAMLQCYALQQKLMSLGVENEIINYICDAADRPLSCRSLRIKGWKKYITSVIGVISRLPKKLAFTKFRNEKLRMTSKVDRRTMLKFSTGYDGYIVGSDNVWNSKLTGLDLNYFLDFVADNRKKTSYAASLGLNDIPEDERDSFRQSLQDFAILTTRERSAAESLQSLLDKPVSDVCDPTLLLTADEWDKLAVTPSEHKKYVLVYHMSPSHSFVEFAKTVAKGKGMPIVYVPFPYGLCKCAIKPHIGPCEWLGYVKNAEYVITDSFHGSVFSILYQRNLIIKVTQLGERLRNLTGKLGIPERIVEDANGALRLPPIDYSQVMPKLATYRQQGHETLERIVEHFQTLSQ